eukprot:IDg6t1
MVPIPTPAVSDAGSRRTTRSMGTTARDRPWSNPPARSANTNTDSQTLNSGAKSSRIPKAEDLQQKDPNTAGTATKDLQVPQNVEIERQVVDDKSVPEEPAEHGDMPISPFDRDEHYDMLAHADRL